MKCARVLGIFILLIMPAATYGQQAADATAAIDKLFERWNSASTPGCAVAVTRDARVILSRAYGMADLEHDVPNTTDTIFEAGSVSKQFTAGAIIMLAQQDKLSLDDNVRKYVPEVPDYGTPITIRNLLTHTSGLRDWGNVESIAGWPRTSRAYTHAHVLDIISRQRALNFTPGAEYSYSNTGFNLLAIIVDRVSGMPFAEFTKKNIFEPLGMTHTQWRDNFKRIVKNRAIAYSQRAPGGFETDMPFENVHGNGGLLTTVGDLLLWTENLETGKVGGRSFLEMMHRQGRLNNGKVITYASGLFITSYRGVPEVSHTGSTAGYRAFLARYPQEHTAVALLCNVGNINPGDVGHKVADIFLHIPPPPVLEEAAKPHLAAEGLIAKAGMYRNTVTGEPLRVTYLDGSLRVQRIGTLAPISETTFRAGEGGRRFIFEASPGGGRPRIRDSRPGEEDVVYEPVAEFTPNPAELAAYAGEFYSPDAETVLTAVVDNGRLVLKRRPNAQIVLMPAYADAFESSLGLIRFIRDKTGQITQFSVRQDRVYDLRFDRVTK